MTAQTYRLTAEQFRSLARGEGQLAAVRILADGQLARRRLLILAVAAEIRRRGGTAVASLEAALALIGAVEHRAFGVAKRVLSHPHLPVWAGRLLGDVAGGDDDNAAVGYLCALAAAAAASAGMSFDITVPTGGEVLVLPTLGAARGIGAGPFRVRGDAQRISVTGENGEADVVAPFRRQSRHWAPLREIALPGVERRFALAIEDVDPHRDCYPWRPSDRLSREAADELRHTCRVAWRLLVRHHPGQARAMRVALRSLVPLDAMVAGARVSATSRDAVGAIAVSLPTDPESLAELLLHEFQHTKLGALSDLVDLHRPDARVRYYAPWRSDPRPVNALLHGAYAHLGVAEYWRFRRSRVTGPGRLLADREFAYWRLEVAAALGRLRGCGELTDLGEAFVGALADALRACQADPVSSGAELAARTRAQARAAAWARAHPHLASGAGLR